MRRRRGMRGRGKSKQGDMALDHVLIDVIATSDAALEKLGNT